MSEIFPIRYVDPVFRPPSEAESLISNWLVLKGILGAEKERLLREVDNAMHRPESARLRADWQRGL